MGCDELHLDEINGSLRKLESSLSIKMRNFLETGQKRLVVDKEVRG